MTVQLAEPVPPPVVPATNSHHTKSMNSLIMPNPIINSLVTTNSPADLHSPALTNSSSSANQKISRLAYAPGSNMSHKSLGHMGALSLASPSGNVPNYSNGVSLKKQNKKRN